MLTIKKKRFAEALHEGKTQHEAAIDAGYSEKTARSKGCHLTKDQDVINYLKMLTPKVNISDPNTVTDEFNKDLENPIEVMTLIMKNNVNTDPKLALDAASKLAPYVKRKLDEPGKKQLKAEKAQAVNRFAALPTPSLKH